PSAAGRRATTRLELPDPPPDAVRTAWALRATDVDLLGHVNNAVYWAAVEEALAPGAGPASALLEHRRPVDLGDAVELGTLNGDLAFVVEGVVWAGARLERGTPVGFD